MTNTKKYDEIFNYLRGDRSPTSPESTVVFGRADEKVAHAAGDLVLANLVDVLVISGGFGKDSGDLKIPEAHFLKDELEKDAQKRGFAVPETLIDIKAKNGGDNARNSIALLNDSDHDSDTMTAVAHATSARRLAETLKHAGTEINGSTPDVFVKPTEYTFDATNPNDQTEARDELLRLDEWPEKDWLLPQLDLPIGLVEFAREEREKSKV